MDFTTVVAAITSQITTGLPVFATLIGLVVGIPLVMKLYRRIAGR